MKFIDKYSLILREVGAVFILTGAIIQKQWALAVMTVCVMIDGLTILTQEKRIELLEKD
jgi:hypothetical protein